MRNAIAMLSAVVTALVFAAGCANPDSKFKEATAAENTGNYREAAKLYSALAIETAPAMKLPEAQKGKVMQPALWQGEMEKYVKWLTEAAPQRSAVLRNSLDGLDRSSEHLEQDNTVSQTPERPLDSLPAFAELWDKAFNPPPPGTIDWHGLTKQAFGKNFSILRFAAPMNYTYDINIISRKTGRRISFTLYSESEIYVPLAPAEYTVILKSVVEFQKGQRWISEYSVFNIGTANSASLINMDLKTKVARK